MPPSQRNRESHKSLHWRKVWDWHLWLGLGVLLPLLFWMGSALVFALWPIQTVRGLPFSARRSAPVPDLQAWMLPPPEKVLGAKSVLLKHVAGHPVAVVDRRASTEVWDLASQASLGATLPLAWVEEVARHDFTDAWDMEAVYLFSRSGLGQLVAGRGPAQIPLPGEYSGPRPVFSFALKPGGTHLYVDALTGEVRARRSRIWRFYDFAFRLHSFEFTGDGTKRIVIALVVGLWMAVGGTGLIMAIRRLRRRIWGLERLKAD